MQSQSKTIIGLGRAMTALAALPFLVSCYMKLSGNIQMLRGGEHLGWSLDQMMKLGVLEAICVLLYLCPPVAVLGAVLLTGYLGGAISTHVRIGEPVSMHIGIGLLIWGGLFLRESRLRELLPIRAKDFKYEREIVIHRSRDTVFSYLKLLKNFQNWNPFLKQDIHVKSEYRGTDGEVGFTAIWDGNRAIGAGEQEIKAIVPNKELNMELRFSRPMQDVAQARMTTESVGPNQTKVMWGFYSRMKFPMIMMKPIMEMMLYKSLKTGLNNLKSVMEK